MRNFGCCLESKAVVHNWRSVASAGIKRISESIKSNLVKRIFQVLSVSSYQPTSKSIRKMPFMCSCWKGLINQNHWNHLWVVNSSRKNYTGDVNSHLFTTLSTNSCFPDDVDSYSSYLHAAISKYRQHEKRIWAVSSTRDCLAWLQSNNSFFTAAFWGGEIMTHVKIERKALPEHPVTAKICREIKGVNRLFTVCKDRSELLRLNFKSSYFISSQTYY